MIRYRILWHLIWVCTICQCSFYGTLGTSELKWKSLLQKDLWAVTWQNQQNGMCAKRRLRSAWASVQYHPSLSTWRKLGSLATHWAHSKDSDLTGQMPRLIWVHWAHMPFCWFCHEAAHLLLFIIIKAKKLAWIIITWSVKNSAQYEPHHKKTCLRGVRPG